MNYITVGDLALELKTSNQKIGQLVKAHDIEIIKKYHKTAHSYAQLKCVSEEDAEKIRTIFPSFTGRQNHGRIKPRKKAEVYSKKIKQSDVENSDEQFKIPIVGRYWGAGKDEQWGQGLQAVWEKERCEIIG